MTFRQNLKEQLRSFPRKGDVAELIDNQQPVAAVSLDQPTQVSAVLGLEELVDQPAARYKPG